MVIRSRHPVLLLAPLLLALLLPAQQATARLPAPSTHPLCAQRVGRFSERNRVSNRVNRRLRQRFGTSCKTQLPSGHSQRDQGEHREEFLKHQRRFLHLLREGEGDPSLYREEQALSAALRSFAALDRELQRTFIGAFADAVLRHFAEGSDLVARLRYNDNFALFIGLLKRSGSSSLLEEVQHLLDSRLQRREEGETPSQFEQRRHLARNLWETARIVLYYWPETLALTQEYPSAPWEKHRQLLTRIAKEAAVGLPRGVEHVHLLIVRNDTGTRAGVGTLWLPVGSSYRAYLHETGHVVHFTHPRAHEAFPAFEQSYAESREGDFASVYHTDAQEDFAETYTEVALGRSSGEHLLDRALRRREEGSPLLLEKVLFLLSSLFDPSEGFVSKYEQDQEALTGLKVPVTWNPLGQITGIQWRGTWVHFSYDVAGRLRGM